MISIFICEDQDDQREGLTKTINDYVTMDKDYSMKIACSTGDPDEILDYVKKQKIVDGLYFLDHHLNANINGVELAEQIREYDKTGIIIMITTDETIMPLTYKHKIAATDFITKGDSKVVRERVIECIELTQDRLVMNEAKRFVFNIPNDKIATPYTDISYFETSSDKNKVVMITKTDRLEFKASLKNIKEKLADSKFDNFFPVGASLGKIGETVDFVAASLLQPDFLPESIEEPIFGIFHNLFSRFPDELLINNTISNHLSSYTNIQPVDIPQLLIDEEYLFLSVEESSRLEWLPRIEILPAEADLQINYEDLIVANNGYVQVQLLLYGGPEAMSRITFFVNHRPVAVNGVDFIEIQVEDGQMALVEVELTLSELNDLNSLYAIVAMPNIDHIVPAIFKTQTLLLVSQ